MPRRAGAESSLLPPVCGRSGVPVPNATQIRQGRRTPSRSRQTRTASEARPSLRQRSSLSGAGSCLCCTQGSRGGIYRSSSGSGRERRATGACVSGRRPVSGSGYTSSCCRSYARPGRSNGRRRSRTGATFRRKGGSATGPSPVDRARTSSKHHLLIDATGIPLAWAVIGGNRTDVTRLIPAGRPRSAGTRRGRPSAPPP
jgi:hypothetical protein